MKKYSLLSLALVWLVSAFAQLSPSFINEKPVTINGLTFDAMEPNLSTDGNALFFNSLNNGITTSLYYASRVDDTTFNFIGLVPVVNQTVTPRLDAVPTLDSINNFYWVSTRHFPGTIENLFRIRFLPLGYTNFGKLYGDFYINSPGYLIMDACTNYHGNQLVYCNAYFNNCANGLPCQASMGIAQKVNDSTFNKYANTSTIMANINDTTNYIVYAPFITKDGLELYYTRLLKTGIQTEIMVAVRSNTNQAFGLPSLLIGAPFFAPEAPALTSDKSKLYYHKKVGNLYKLFLRYRSTSTALNEQEDKIVMRLYPNPVSDVLTLNVSVFKTMNKKVYILSALGEIVLSEELTSANHLIDMQNFSEGVYILRYDNAVYKLVKH